MMFITSTTLSDVGILNSLAEDREQGAEAEHAEADHAHAHHRAAGEGDRQAVAEALAGGVGGADVGLGGHPHADEAGQRRAEGADDERDGDQRVDCFPMRIRRPAASRTATLTTKIASTLYSARRKAMAPSWMASAMRFIFSVPASCLATQADRQKVKARPSRPKTGMV